MRILSVEVVRSSSVYSAWKGQIQKIQIEDYDGKIKTLYDNPPGTTYANLGGTPGFDWSYLIGVEIEYPRTDISIVTNRGLKWLKKVK